MDRNYYKNGIPHETPITSWRWVGQKFSRTVKHLFPDLMVNSGLAQKSRSEKIISICKNHYMKTWGQFSLDPNYIPHLSVSFYIYFVWAMFKSLSNIN